MTAFTVAGASLRRYVRDRTAMFFVVALPVLVIVVLGVTLSGFGQMRIRVVNQGSGPISERIVAGLERSSALEVQRSGSVTQSRTAVRRGEATVAVVIPADLDAKLRRGEQVSVAVLGDRTSSSQQAALSAVASVVAAEAGRVQAARFATDEAGGTLDENLARADEAAAASGPIVVRTDNVDRTRHTLPEGFSYSAPTMLVLFVFINSLAGGAAIIQTQRLGLYERMSAAPVHTGAIVAGETLCYLSMALLQSALIVGVGAVVFDVHWGDPLAAVTLVAAWALVGTGAGVLSGTLFRTPEQASSIGPAVGMACGMLGGCMWPLEIVPPVMRTAGHLFPHAWAVDAWTVILSRGGGLADIAVPLLVLGGFAAALLMIATTRMRHRVMA